MASMAPSPTSHGFLWATAGRMGQGQQLGHAGGAGGGNGEGWGELPSHLLSLPRPYSRVGPEPAAGPEPSEGRLGQRSPGICPSLSVCPRL